MGRVGETSSGTVVREPISVRRLWRVSTSSQTDNGPILSRRHQTERTVSVYLHRPSRKALRSIVARVAQDLREYLKMSGKCVKTHYLDRWLDVKPVYGYGVRRRSSAVLETVITDSRVCVTVRLYSTETMSYLSSKTFDRFSNNCKSIFLIFWNSYFTLTFDILKIYV